MEGRFCVILALCASYCLVQQVITESTAVMEPETDQILQQFSSLGSMMSNKLKTITDIVVPDVCKKGMRRYLTQYAHYTMTSPNNNLAFPFLCDTFTDGGGWIVIQRRVTGDINFDQNWATYKNGFGCLGGDFWLGNEKIHAITSSGTYELRVEMKYKWKSAYAFYTSFSIASESDNYRLAVGPYKGSAGDALHAHHDGMPFSTRDRDNDRKAFGSCSKEEGGGWWFHYCDDANLNGRWGKNNDFGVEWTPFVVDESLTSSIMKIRKV